ncbi:hypothetical protein AB0L53_33230 [Nonomuraea sp. NPDC052129]
MGDESTALRALRKAGGPEILDVLAERLSGADLWRRSCRSRRTARSAC